MHIQGGKTPRVSHVSCGNSILPSHVTPKKMVQSDLLAKVVRNTELCILVSVFLDFAIVATQPP